jgi:iron complex transport system ATP-binding protein
MSLRVDHLSFSYPNLPVLREVSFTVDEGDFLSLLGPNGSGKSTLLRLIDRILMPNTGTIHLKDKPLTAYSRRELARIVSYVPQESVWTFPFTVLEVVLMGRSPYIGRWGFENEEDYEIARCVMQATSIEHLGSKPMTALSGGERQRVLIARALCQRPKILLLDEPNAHLDIAHQIEIFNILQRENENELTIVSVSHDLNLAAAYSKHIALLAPQTSAEGVPAGTGSTIVALGAPQDVLTASNIQIVFRTNVLVDRNPRTSTIRISPTP